jgi:hypothetical protein
MRQYDSHLDCRAATPDRHGTLIDVFEKIVGGALGIFAARAIHWYARTRGKFQN